MSLSTGISETDFVFTAISPKIIQQLCTYNVFVTVEKGETPVKFIISITSSDDSQLFTCEPAQVAPGTSILMGIPITDKLTSDEPYNLKIKAQYGEDKNFEDSVKIHPDPHVLSLFIQTDKPVYKPGETVKFRVIPLDRNLKPHSKPEISFLSMKDPQGNIIKKWTEIDTKCGLFSSELTLSAEPNLGDWTLEVKTALDSEQHEETFSVEQYVLPKFKAEVKLPPFATYKESKIQAEIKAAYTYGKGVKGEAKVTLSSYSPHQIYYRGGCMPPPPESKKVVKTVPIDGSVFVEFDITTDLGIEKGLTYDMEFSIEAEVTETVTGKIQTSSGRIKLYEHPYKIELVNSPKNYKPGFPLTLTMRVSTQDNVPVQDSNPEALTVLHGFAYDAEDGIWKSNIPANGLVTKTFITPSNEFVNIHNIEVRYKEMKTMLYLPPRLSSDSKKYFQITPAKTELQEGENIWMDFQANEPLSSVTYILYARGKIQATGTSTSNNGNKKAINNVKMAIPSNIGAKALLVAYAISSTDNEVLVDSVEMKLLTPSLQNHLKVNASTKQAEPGSTVSISLESKENSLVALRGVDQSVLILKQDKNIDMDRVEKELKTLDEASGRYKIWGGSNSFQVMEDAGLVCITNGKYEKVVYQPIHPYSDFAAPEMAMMADAPVMMKGGANMMKRSANFAPEAEIAPPRVRTKFPETWIWDEIQLDGVSNTKLEKIVPDTLTSWMISGFSLNSEHGIGVTLEPTVMEVFRPFFITLNKPYSVVKGEILALQVLVHNYQSSEVNAKIVFGNGEKKFQFGDGEKTAESQTKTVSVKPKDVASVTFLIVPQEFGVLKLNVVGTTENSGDAISQPLIVKPPGQKQIGNEAVLINMGDSKIFESIMKAAFPEKRVDGADYMKIFAVGDIMGSAMKNLDQLLQMPCGCGEQNMLSFVPDLVILDYLQVSSLSSHEVDPKIQKKAIQYLEHGYQRELSYRHDDGSFSAFGKSDPSGSTWLTAFVVRYFISAKRYITIDDQILESGLQFLIGKQQFDGEFREHGKIIHSELKGGVESGKKDYALSAYVLLTLLEASRAEFKSTLTENFRSVVKKGFEYITSIPEDCQDSYAMNLVTYTLEFADHPTKEKYFARMETLAKSEGNHKWWENQMSHEDIELFKHCCIYQPWRKPTKPACVEMTAYALLTHMSRGNKGAAFPIVKWLLSQRNQNGGFISTQDTVVGLTALGKFAEITKSSSKSLVIDANYGPKTIQWVVQDDNSDVLQENELPSDTREVSIKATGEGTALVQLTWSFYVEDLDKLPAFSIDAMVIQYIFKLCS